MSFCILWPVLYGVNRLENRIKELHFEYKCNACGDRIAFDRYEKICGCGGIYKLTKRLHNPFYGMRIR